MEKEKKLPVRVSMEFNFDLDNVYTPYYLPHNGHGNSGASYRTFSPKRH